MKPTLQRGLDKRESIWKKNVKRARGVCRNHLPKRQQRPRRPQGFCLNAVIAPLSFRAKTARMPPFS
jgi:hypothetical protein